MTDAARASYPRMGGEESISKYVYGQVRSLTMTMSLNDDPKI